LLSKISTKVKSTIECKRQVLLNASVKNNRTFFTKNTLLWVYTKTLTWELIGTIRWIHTNTLMWELIGKDNGLTWVYTNTLTWELIGTVTWVYTNTLTWELNRYGRMTTDNGPDNRRRTTTHFKSFQNRYEIFTIISLSANFRYSEY